MEREVNELRDIAVAGLAAENLGGEVWNDMAKWVNAHKDMADSELKRIINTMERQFRHDYSTTTMPSAYRSAKSVAMAARKTGVVLVEANGEASGKTAVEGAIKAVRAVSKAVAGVAGIKGTPIDAAIEKLHTWIVIEGKRPDNIPQAQSFLTEIVRALRGI